LAINSKTTRSAKSRRNAFAWRTFAGAVWLSACSVYSLPDQGSQPLEAGGASASAGSESGASGGTAGASLSGGSSGVQASGGMPSAGSAATSAIGGATPEAGAPTELNGPAGAGGADGVVGSAGAPDTTGSAGAPASGPTSYRYVKLLATSEQAGNVWSSVAELQVMTTGGKALARSGWSITADSEELVQETAPATNAIDGDNATYWHTHWEWVANQVNDAPLPHYLIIDLGTAAPITGFSYLPRQNSANGRIKAWSFYVSNDGTTWGTPVKSGTFATGAALQTITF
jgi:hypothetical protein